MFCPLCKSEYRQGFLTCANCSVPLVAELPLEEPARGEAPEDETSALPEAASRETQNCEDLKPDIEAEITVLPRDENSPVSPLRDDIIGYHECLIVLPSGTWDCRMVFPDADGRVDFGQTANALIRLKSPNEALNGLTLGDGFQLLRETTYIANGRVTKFITAPIKGELKLEFIGSSKEYFRIWIVNLCLTLLTFGIFSAWAKVRKKRYFYSNTILDGTPFQYLGQPLPIFKGRIIGATLFAVYFVADHFLISLVPYVLALGVGLAPWVIIRSAAFRARYSAFRNMTFCFEGNYRNTLKLVFAWGMVPAIIVAMMFNWWKITWLKGALFASAGLLFPWWISRFKSFIIWNTAFGGKNGKLSTTGGQFFSIYFWAGMFFALIIAAMGVLLTIFGIFKSSVYFEALASVPIYAGYVLAYAYVQAHSGNLVWNETTLGPLRFSSTLRGLPLAKYYMTNALAIVVSAGLLTPWAVIRTMKYRADSLRVWRTGELTDFAGSDMSSVSAAGSELGEFFDMDLSL